MPVPAITQAGLDPFIAARLARVRGMLDRLDALMEKERDPHCLDRLASAQARLARPGVESNGAVGVGSARRCLVQPRQWAARVFRKRLFLS